MLINSTPRGPGGAPIVDPVPRSPGGAPIVDPIPRGPGGAPIVAIPEAFTPGGMRPMDDPAESVRQHPIEQHFASSNARHQLGRHIPKSHPLAS